MPSERIIESEEFAAIFEEWYRRIRVAIREYKGARFLDIRIYYRDGEEPKPTGKGVAIGFDKVHCLHEAIIEAEAAIEAETAEASEQQQEEAM